MGKKVEGMPSQKEGQLDHYLIHGEQVRCNHGNRNKVLSPLSLLLAVTPAFCMILFGFIPKKYKPILENKYGIAVCFAIVIEMLIFICL